MLKILALRPFFCSIPPSFSQAHFDGTDEGYPFEVRVRFTHTLDARGGYRIDVSAVNTASDGRAAPFMVGWHPYFRVSDVASATVTLDSRSEALWGFFFSLPAKRQGERPPMSCLCIAK